jgi:hypothetical protein
MSNGEKANSPSYKKLDRKIRKLQRKLARQPHDSKRRNVTRIRVAKLHNRIADSRKDFLHKLSTKSVKNHRPKSAVSMSIQQTQISSFPRVHQSQLFVTLSVFHQIRRFLLGNISQSLRRYSRN